MPSDTIGSIKVPRMILTSSLLSLGSLYICWANCEIPNATIMQTTLEYPYTIIFRIGMLYSLFIFALQMMFIKWWLDSSQIASRTTLIAALGTQLVYLGILSLAFYGLFVSCIDRKTINYTLSEWSVFLSCGLFAAAVSLMMLQLRKINSHIFPFLNETSWVLKKVVYWAHMAWLTIGLMIYAGAVDIYLKTTVEYGVLVTAVLFLATFIIDFRAFDMDVITFPIPQLSQTQIRNEGMHQ